MKHTRIFLTVFLPICVVLTIGLSLKPAEAQADTSGFTDVQKEQIRDVVRQYILENPEIIPEAIDILRSRQIAHVLAQYHEPLYNDGISYVGGNPNGDLTIIEFFDYNCSYCKKAMSTVNRLLKEDKGLRIIYKEFPILAESSVTAAKASLAAIRQGKYEEFHKALMKNRKPLDEELIFSIARNVGLDEQKLAVDMTDPAISRSIEENTALARALNITGTPAFIIGNTIIPGALPYEELKKTVAKARKDVPQKASR
ncbi:DsbA family protein [Luteithermobacter gelatinilyticus]|uniref:DsbA family protein n=1 Tax=Luteithermobacter gelatinilyticus TaxID=2582913 RepID=UPI001105FE92|nr:DsbA family protein [Luteithermobacter gelatinilyticus]|tara:strand:- start:25477 stop:26244 length:768 start_codon:yes stop_codon:yes gene_type:complete